MVSTLKHDHYLEDLCNQIKDDYDELYTNITIFSKKKRKVAEIDILAVKGEKYDIYEVKCSYRIKKAVKQLKKIKKLLPGVKEMFFFCGESGCLETI